MRRTKALVSRRMTTRLSGTIGLSLVAMAINVSCAPSSSPPPQSGVTDVAIRNMAFSPASITIEVNESVRWTNQDFVPHSATSGDPGDADAGEAFETGDLGLGDSATITFNEPGEYVYFCRWHPTEMRGARISVTE